MGFWDFFKKKKEPEEITKIEFSEIKEWIKSKKKQIEIEEKDFLKQIQDRISQLLLELEEGTGVLEKIDLKEIKVEEKIRLIVDENLNHYILHLKRLTESLGEIGDLKLVGVEEKLSLIFSNFKQKSFKSFQKATFLIGKELGAVSDNVNNFLRDLENILKENKDLVINSKTILLVEEKLKEINEQIEIKNKVKEDILKFEKNKKDLEYKKENITKEIEKTKQSEGYAEEIKKKELLEKMKNEFKIEISELKDIIDFKLLAEKFHSDKKKMEVIKSYREDFQRTFQEDKGAKIINLLGEAEMKKEEVIKGAEELTHMQEKIDNVIISKDGIKELEDKMRKTQESLENLEDEKSRQEKRRKKIEASKNSIINSIKEELIKVRVDIKI